jgi:ABC-type glycerol-3-phosphate transport system substrate-binding protein
MRQTKTLRSVLLTAAVVVAVAVVAGCGGSSSSGGKVTLTLWHNYGTEGNAVATQNLVKAFEKLHPNIKINVVSQPASNYFALLQASQISHTGPDLAVMWTGLYDLKYQNLLVNLKPYFPSSELSKLNGLQWTAPNFDLSNGFYVMPLEDQFYMGFYNKALFKRAGITSVPRDWSELSAACSKLSKLGVAPIVYGADPQAISSEPYPFYDLSYLMAGVYSPSQWRGLYSGQIPWTSPAVVSQVSRWASMPKSGCTNSDVLTKTDILGAFIKGKAAMIIDGNWDAATLEKGLGSNVAPMVPPFTSQPQRGVVQYSGDGFSVMKNSSHIPQAVEFLKFMMTPQASRIIAAAGLIPDIKGYKTSNPLSNAMLAFAAQQHLTPYPMIDNVIQPEVVTTGMKQLDAALGGDISASSALGSMKQTLSALPSDRRGSTYR